MIALTTPYLWYTTRATGVVSLLLFTLVASLGMLVANRVGGTFVGRFELNELHRSLSIVAMVFLGVHILTTLADSFVNTGWISAVVPFTSSYRTTAVALGAIAFDLTLVVWITSMLKMRIKNASWRAIHWFTYLAFSSSLVHAYLAGTDSRSGAGFLLVVGCAGAFALASAWRFLQRPTRAAGRTALSPLAGVARSATSSNVRSPLNTSSPSGRSRRQPLGQRVPPTPSRPSAATGRPNETSRGSTPTSRPPDSPFPMRTFERRRRSS